MLPMANVTEFAAKTTVFADRKLILLCEEVI